MLLPAPGLLRRLGAMFYDALLLVALWMILTAALLPLSGGEAITSASAGLYEYGYRLLLAAVAMLFFGYPWTRNGQTLGMAAWRLKLVRYDGALPTWCDAIRRLAAALLSLAALGLGVLWVLIDRDRLTWHDRLSRTRVVLLPKK